jgi:hypothetical protein
MGEEEMIKDNFWNVSVTLIALVMLAGGSYLGNHFIALDRPFGQNLQALALILGMPTVLCAILYEKINKEAGGTILAVLVGFAVGKFV